MVSIQVTSSHAPVQYRRPFRLRAGSTAWCVAAVHTGAVSTDRVPLLDGPEPRAHLMDVDPGAEYRRRPHRGRRRAVDHTFGRVDAEEWVSVRWIHRTRDRDQQTAVTRLRCP